MNLFVAKVVVTLAVEIGIVCIIMLVGFARYLISLGDRSL